jgi:hypothetical protein
MKMSIFAIVAKTKLFMKSKKGSKLGGGEAYDR